MCSGFLSDCRLWYIVLFLSNVISFVLFLVTVLFCYVMYWFGFWTKNKLSSLKLKTKTKTVTTKKLLASSLMDSYQRDKRSSNKTHFMVRSLRVENNPGCLSVFVLWWCWFVCDDLSPYILHCLLLLFCSNLSASLWSEALLHFLTSLEGDKHFNNIPLEGDFQPVSSEEGKGSFNQKPN